MTAVQMETMLEQGNRKEAEEVMEFLDSLTQNEKRDFFIFMQGAKFAKALPTGKPAPAVQTA